VLDRDGSVAWSGGGASDAALAQMTAIAHRAVETRAIATESTEGTPR